MSWDLVVFSEDTPTDIDSDEIARFADNWVPSDLGALLDVQQTISNLFPKTNWSDPTWGTLIDDNFSLEFSVGDVEVIRLQTQ